MDLISKAASADEPTIVEGIQLLCNRLSVELSINLYLCADRVINVADSSRDATVK
jgi:hypothetical protein